MLDSFGFADIPNREAPRGEAADDHDSTFRYCRQRRPTGEGHCGAEEANAPGLDTRDS